MLLVECNVDLIEVDQVIQVQHSSPYSCLYSHLWPLIAVSMLSPLTAASATPIDRQASINGQSGISGCGNTCACDFDVFKFALNANKPKLLKLSSNAGSATADERIEHSAARRCN